MSTVDKTIADRIIAGEFPEDRAVKIVEYDNAWGGVGYGVIFKGNSCKILASIGKQNNYHCIIKLAV